MICTRGHATRVYTLGFAAPCGSLPSPESQHSGGRGGGGRARTGAMPAHSCNARTPREATAAWSGCALLTMLRSLDCQPWQVWAAGSRFNHFRGDLTRQVMNFEKCIHMWTQHHNEDTERFHHHK
ncbi:unnamed protein product, partial [Rangifer tarandus platyrhynchus]